MGKTLEIIYLENAGRNDTWGNIRAALDSNVWKYGVMPPQNGWEVEDPTSFWWADILTNNWHEVLFEDIKARMVTTKPETANYVFKLNDCKAGGKTFGLDGSVHIDKDFNFNDRGDGFMTFCYFPMADWDPQDGGELQFFDHNGNVIASYLPTPNSCIVFDSNIPHRGLAPTRNCKELRMFVTYKTIVHKNWNTAVIENDTNDIEVSLEDDS